LPWFEIDIFAWDDIQLRNRGLKQPTLVFLLRKDEPFFNQSVWTDRQAAHVQVTASADFITIVSADGTSQRISVPGLRNIDSFVLSATAKEIQVELPNMSNQSFVAHIPDFMVNGEVLKGGALKLTYAPKVQHGGC
jgi:hypothetical protein